MRFDAVLFDNGGTLTHRTSPVAMVRALAARSGVDISEEDAARYWRRSREHSRSLMAEKLIAREQSGQVPLTPRQVTAVIRMFVSTMGWHLLTEQCGLSTNEAAAASAWATRTLLDAAIAKRTTKRTAKPSSSPSQGGANATRRRRN